MNFKLVSVMAMAVTLVACGASAAPASPAPTPTPEPTEQQIAQQAVARLGTLNTFHFDLATDTGGKSAGSGSGFVLLSARGDVARPDKLSASLNASLAGFTAAFSYTAIDGKHYMTDPISKQWIEVPPQFNTVAVFSPETGAPNIVKSLQNLAKAGTEQVDGVSSYHLTGMAPGDVLQPLLGASAPAPLKADVWVGTADFLTRKITLTGAIFQGEPDTTVRTLALSKFDEPVTIVAPSPGARSSS